MPSGSSSAGVAGTGRWRPASWRRAADAILGDPRRGHPVALFGQAHDRSRAARLRGRAAMGIGYAPAASCSARARCSWLRASPRHPGRAWPRSPRRRPGPRSRPGHCARPLVRSGLPRRRRPGPCPRRAPVPLRPRPAWPGPRADHQGRRRVRGGEHQRRHSRAADLGSAGRPRGLSGYRAVNTLDAMVGHHSPRYEHFGTPSARLDDVANWIPARVTAVLAAACSPAVRGRPGTTWQTARDYGPRHPSPSGWCEAAFAGALGVRLGGPLSYAGRPRRQPKLSAGHPPRRPTSPAPVGCAGQSPPPQPLSRRPWPYQPREQAAADNSKKRREAPPAAGVGERLGGAGETAVRSEEGFEIFSFERAVVFTDSPGESAGY